MNQGRSKEQYRSSAIGAFVSIIGIVSTVLSLIILNIL
tara:strand:- start:766 stop:879 length:114 start_codon:yes stop_codon:yes gene_type:complete